VSDPPTKLSSPSPKLSRELPISSLSISFPWISCSTLLDIHNVIRDPRSFFARKWKKYGEEVAAETAGVCLVCVYGAFIQERHSTSEVRWKEERRKK
jgi:hypothetical protein